MDRENTMWIADNWKDYEVLDTSSGEKLERWGDYILVRPDPQVIWNTPHDHAGWSHKNGHYHRSAKGGGEWDFSPEAFQFQTYRSFPGAGGKLGLVFPDDP